MHNDLIRFHKMHALGNDFVIIDNTKYKIKFEDKTLQLLCNRNLGIGCDQLLIIEHLEHNKFLYYVYNNDGSVAMQCGNGARCIIWYIKHHYELQKNVELLIGGQIVTGNTYINSNECYAELPPPQFIPTAIPFLGQLDQNHSFKYQFNHNEFGNELLTVGVVSVGNPHAIILVSSSAKLKQTKYLQAVANDIQNNSIFPHGVNVNFIYINPEQNNQIEITTIERGAGLTKSCGSGACASSCYAIINGLCANSVVVKSQGGIIKIEWTPTDNTIHMEGAVTYVFGGVIAI